MSARGFSFDERTAKDLKFVGTLPVDQLKAFCNIALEFIKSGANPKLFERAASQVRVSPDVIENSVIGLVQILIDATKSKVGEGKFMVAATELPLSDEAKAVVLQALVSPTPGSNNSRSSHDSRDSRNGHVLRCRSA